MLYAAVSLVFKEGGLNVENSQAVRQSISLICVTVKYSQCIECHTLIWGTCFKSPLYNETLCGDQPHLPHRGIMRIPCKKIK